jgi:hypothetical protein
VDEASSEKVTTLVTNLKILSVVALNNPEFIRYMMEYRIVEHNLTVYEVLIETLCTNLAIFAELSLVFLKSNLGFVSAVDEGRRKIIPESFRIEGKIKGVVLAQLEKLLEEHHCDQRKLEGILKTCEFITRIANSSYRPNFRIYKFGSVVNPTYNEIV